MPRRPRLAAGDLAYHVLNRRVGRLPLFAKRADYAAFEKILAEAHTHRREKVPGVFSSLPICVNRQKGPGTIEGLRSQ